MRVAPKNAAVAGGLLALLSLLLLSAYSGPPASESPSDSGSTVSSPVPFRARNRYIGAKACKNCHKAKSKGDQFGKWQKMKHSKAWETLGTDEAKKVAAKRGIENPQKDKRCLKCHVTGFGEKKKQFKRSFSIKQGVQCETCHGPGEQHAKIRFRTAAKSKADPDKFVKIPDDEIIKKPEIKHCLECHNKKSPSFKPFCYSEMMAKIEHLDPRIKRSKEELAARKCKCGKDCKCTQAECDLARLEAKRKAAAAKKGKKPVDPKK